MAPLSNAERQQRWRERTKARAEALDGSPQRVAEAIFAELGVDRARKVVSALDKRLRKIKPDCPACHGTGVLKFENSAAPCPCDEEIAAATKRK